MAYPNEFAFPSMSDCDPDQLFVCPFDKVHRILAKRYPYHIMKCRKNHRTAKVHFCPFNARHIVPVSELRHHVASCPDRSTIEPDLAYAQSQNGADGSYMKGDTSVPSYRHSYEPISSENWDIEESEPRRAYCEAEEPEKIHSLVGMTKAQRREFNRKLLEVHKTNNAEMGNGEEPTEPDFCEEEVRRPKQLPKAVPRSSLDQQYLPPQSGAKLPVERGIPHGPIGVGRSMLMSGQNSMPRPGTTSESHMSPAIHSTSTPVKRSTLPPLYLKAKLGAVQGRSIAANIFNSRDTDEESTSDRQEGGPRRAPTVALAASSIAPLVHTTTVPQSEFNNSPLPTNSGHNLAGLGRGLGVPRGSKRPGLGMPAVGLQSSTQTPGYPWTQP